MLKKPTIVKKNAGRTKKNKLALKLTKERMPPTKAMQTASKKLLDLEINHASNHATKQISVIFSKMMDTMSSGVPADILTSDTLVIGTLLEPLLIPMHKLIMTVETDIDKIIAILIQETISVIDTIVKVRIINLSLALARRRTIILIIVGVCTLTLILVLVPQVILETFKDTLMTGMLPTCIFVNMFMMTGPLHHNNNRLTQPIVDVVSINHFKQGNILKPMLLRSEISLSVLVWLHLVCLEYHLG